MLSSISFKNSLSESVNVVSWDDFPTFLIRINNLIIKTKINERIHHEGEMNASIIEITDMIIGDKIK
jgi:hypothetical protein